MINQLEPKHLGLSNRLLEFLAPEEDKRLTKLEAFRDLLEMATHFKGHVSCYGQEFDLVPGEVITSISELATSDCPQVCGHACGAGTNHAYASGEVQPYGAGITPLQMAAFRPSHEPAFGHWIR